MSEAITPENDADVDVSVTWEAPCLPGAVLRAAREAKGLSPDAVAQVTRFSVRQIEALERDDYASLPGITAVRGFVRSYAKFLKLDATPLLAALAPAAPMALAEVRPPGHVGDVQQATRLRRFTFRRMAIVMACCLVLLAGLWYFIRPGNEAIHGYLQTLRPAPEVAVSPAPPPAAEPALAAPVVAPVPAEIASAGTVSQPAVSAPPAQGLRLEFDARSWIEIRDATQQVVFSGEYPAGTRQDVAGKPPFQLWIGRASGVRVFFGERNIDLQPYTREDVARLTVE